MVLSTISKILFVISSSFFPIIIFFCSKIIERELSFEYLINIGLIFFKISFAWIVPIIPATVPKIPSYSQFNISSEIVSSWKKLLIQGVFFF